MPLFSLPINPWGWGGIWDSLQGAQETQLGTSWGALESLQERVEWERRKQTWLVFIKGGSVGQCRAGCAGEAGRDLWRCDGWELSSGCTELWSWFRAHKEQMVATWILSPCFQEVDGAFWSKMELEGKLESLRELFCFLTHLYEEVRIC